MDRGLGEPRRDLSHLAPARSTSGAGFPYWAEWVDHAVNDDFWRERDVPPAAPIPTLIVAGWHDVFLGSSLTEYAKRADHPDTRLVVGPWSHGTSPGVEYGGLEAMPGTATGGKSDTLTYSGGVGLVRINLQNR